MLDPVTYGAILKWRSDMTDTLVSLKPTVIRGNASEISALAGNQVQSKGVDSTVASHEVYKQALPLLQNCECVAISGESDFILSKELNAVIQVNGGSFLQPKIFILRLQENWLLKKTKRLVVLMWHFWTKFIV